MMQQGLRTRLLKGELLVGPVVTLPAPEVSEILAGLGFDWLFIDCEHAPLGIREAQTLVQAAAPHCACLVRVPAGEEVWLKKVLDIGAAGVIIPQVHSAAQAEQVVRLCKYPPRGTRGVGVARAQGYGRRLDEYLTSANEETVVVIQVESEEAVQNVASIIRVPDIDAILIGPYDLSASLGRAGHVQDPVVKDAIATVSATCRRAGMRLGAFGANAAAVRPFIEDGFTLIAVGIDTLYLTQAATDALAVLR